MPRVQGQCAGGALTCDIRVVLHDSYGDGWNGAALQFYQGSTLRGTATIGSGRSYEGYMQMCPEDVVLIWQAGHYDSETSFEVYTSSGDLAVAIANGSTLSNGDTVAVFRGCPTCPRPENFRMIGNTMSQLILAWHPRGEESQWQMEYGAAGFERGNGTTLTLTDTIATLTGLDSATRYDAYLKAVCADTDQSSEIQGTFATQCCSSPCDMRLVMHGGDGWYNNRIAFYQHDIMLGAYSGIDYGDSVAYIPVCPDTLDLVWQSEGYRSDLTFELYDGDETLVAVGNGDTLWDGDLVARIVNSCPTCLMPSNFRKIGNELDQLTLAWHPRGEESQWQVEYGAAGFARGTGTTLSVTDTLLTVAGLDSATAYDFYLKAVCSATEQSNERLGRFTTQCCSNPCEMRIAMHSRYGYGWEDAQLYVYQLDSLLATFTMPNGSHDEEAFFSACPDSVTLVWHSGWDDYQTSFELYDNDDVMVAAVSGDTISNGDTVARILNSCPTCPRPTNFRQTENSLGQMTLAWHPRGEESQWQMEYGAAGFARGTGTTLSVTDTLLTVTGLDSATVYDFYLRAACSASDSSRELHGAFATQYCSNPCELMLVMHESYGDTWNGAQLNIIQGSNLIEATIDESGVHEDTIMLSLCPGDVRLQWVPGNYDNEASFEIYDNNEDQVVAFNGSEDVPFDITFANSCSSCPRPRLTQLEVTDHSAAFLCTHTAAVEAEYRRAEDEDYTAVVLTGDTLRLAGLVFSTAYQLRVRSLCGAGETSAWREASFETPIQLIDRFYIKPTATGSGNGLSWADAADDIGDVVEMAYEVMEEYPDLRPQVWMAQGVYYGNTDAASGTGAFTTYAGIDIYGGFAGNEPADYDLGQRDLAAHATILDGQGSRRVLYQPSYISDSCVWDGVTIRNGRSTDGGGAYLRGGGILRNSTITGCTATSTNSNYGNGGGVYLYGGTLRNSTVDSCTATARGGGIYLYGGTVANCAITDNNATTNNVNTAGGGGVCLREGLIVGSLIANNSAYIGGGLYAFSYTTAAFCDIVANEIRYDYNNNNNLRTAGIYGTPYVYNSVIWGNGGSHPSFQSQIGQVAAGTYHNCAVQGDVTAYSFNDCISLSESNDDRASGPRFVHPASGIGLDHNDGNWRLLPASPLRDRSTLYADYLPSEDLLGNGRIYNGLPDIGCYEFDGTVPCIPPEGIAITALGTTARISWSQEQGCDPAGIELEYRRDSDGDWATMALDGTANDCFLQQLDTQATYEVRIRTLCADSSYSDYSGISTFRTHCHLGMDTVLTVNAGARGTTSRFPINTEYNDAYYSYSQQIYRAEQLQGFAGVIDTLYFHATTEDEMTNRVQLFLGLTDKERFENGNDYIDPASLIQVYSGQFYNIGGGWMGLPLDETFVYDGSHNLVVAMINNDTVAANRPFYQQYDPSYYNNRIFVASSNHLDVSQLPTGTVENSSQCELRLATHHCDSNGCQPPVLYLSHLSDSNATLSWQSPSRCLLQYRPAGGEYINVDVDTLREYTLSHLRMNENYEVRIRRWCGNNRYSPWQTLRFTTLVLPLNRIYVSATAAGSGNGQSWDNAAADLGWAISMASQLRQRGISMPDIWVSQGTYYGNTVSTNAFTLVEGIDMYGGFAGNEPEDYDLSQRDFAAHATILDARYSNRVIAQTTEFATPTLCDGFTLQHGYVTDANGAGANFMGGVTLRNCIVQDNILHAADRTSLFGAGIFVNGSVNIDRCIIRNNSFESTASRVATVTGGGIADSYDISRTSNHLIISNSQIVGNVATTGGGAYLYGSDTLYNTLVAGNEAHTGGGLYVDYSYNLARIYNATVVGNHATGSSAQGSGIFFAAECGVYNSIIWGNTANNASDNIYKQQGRGTLYNCAVGNDYADPENNSLTLDPVNDGTSNAVQYVRFVDPVAGNYRLHPASSCVDYGNSSYLHLDNDIDGNGRIQGTAMDLGAYECAEATGCPSPINLRSSNVTGYNATIAWTPRGTESQWRLQITCQQENLDSILLLNDTIINLTDLHINRSYTVRVDAVCGDGYSLTSPQLTFTTLCDAAGRSLSSFTNMMPIDSTIINQISNYYTPTVNFSWDSIPEATSYDFYFWEAGFREPTEPTVSGLVRSQLTYILPYYEPGLHYFWKVVAWNECLSQTSDVHYFCAEELPNLHVTALSNSEPIAGMPMTVTWTVRNDGEGSTPLGLTWQDNLWLVSNFEVRANDPFDRAGHLLSVPNLRSLRPGESYTRTDTVMIPETFIGTFYLFLLSNQLDLFHYDLSSVGNIIPDPYQPDSTGFITAEGQPTIMTLRETNPSDNFFFKHLTILPGATPDLQVTAANHPIDANSNSNIIIQWRVENRGSNIANRGWDDAVYFHPADSSSLGIQLAKVHHSAPLDTGQYYIGSALVHLPIWYSGDYSIVIVTDVDDNVFESTLESNNQYESTQNITIHRVPLADLAITNFTAPDSVSPRVTYNVSWTVTNHGYATTEESSWFDRLYMAPADGQFNPYTATLLSSAQHFHELPIGGTYTVNTIVTFPDTEANDYRLVLFVDADGGIFEDTAESDNMRMVPLRLSVPDLIITEPSMQWSGETSTFFDVTAYLKNVGEGVAKGFVYNTLYLGTLTDQRGVSLNLAPGDSVGISFHGIEPCISGNDGTFRIVANTMKYGTRLYEDTAYNNNVSETVHFEPRKADFYVTGLTYPDSALSGSELTVSYWLHNSGNTDLLGNGTVPLSIYYNESPSAVNYATQRRLYNIGSAIRPELGDSIFRTNTVTIPDGIEGNYYLHVVVDRDNTICEQDESNNITYGLHPIHVALAQYSDLQVASFTMPDTLFAGTRSTIDFAVTNQGSRPAIGNLSTKLFVSHSANYVASTAVLVGHQAEFVTIEPGDTLNSFFFCNVPNDFAAGDYYCHAVTDFNECIYETDETNNVLTGANTIRIMSTPVDLRLDSVVGPTHAQWGERVRYTLHMTNVSDYATTADQWSNRICLASDTIMSNNDLMATSKYRLPLRAGGSYSTTLSLTIPMGADSLMYLFAIADALNNQYDIDRSNNTLRFPIGIDPVPVPDLAITDVQLLDPLVAGQPARLTYTVTNVGDTLVSTRWTDKVFYTYTHDIPDMPIATNSHYTTLAVDSSITNTVSITIPVPYSGDMDLVLRINTNQSFYEKTMSNNDTAVEVTVTLSNPGDLVITRIHAPETMVSGSRVPLQWTLANIGTYAISGKGLSTLVYLSEDDVFDASDKLLGTVDETSVNLMPGDTLQQQLDVRVTGVAEGTYHLIVLTDVRNAFQETDEDNNISVTPPCHVTLRELLFNVPLSDTLVNGQPNNYKLSVLSEAGETAHLLISSDDSLSGTMNTLYVSQGAMADNINSTYSTIGQHVSNPELYIPSLRPGYYGVSLYGNSVANQPQAVTVEAEILPFELSAITPNEGGNTGGVTIELKGSHFRPDMRVWMCRGGDTIFAESLIFSDISKAYCHFNLDGADTGLYNVGILNYCEGVKMLHNAFHVVEGSSDLLGYSVILPVTPRSLQSITIALEFENLGNNDIQDAVVEIGAYGNTVLARSYEGLADSAAILRVPLTIEGEPQGLLRPGVKGIITLYCHVGEALVTSIKRVK